MEYYCFPVVVTFSMIRPSREAAFRLPVILGTWDHVEALVEEFRMKLLAGHPKSNGEQQTVRVLCDGLTSSFADIPICLVLGSEGRVLSEKSKTSCELVELVSIRMSGKFESLNISVAGGIFMFMLQPQNINFSSRFSRPVCEGDFGRAARRMTPSNIGYNDLLLLRRIPVLLPFLNLQKSA